MAYLLNVILGTIVPMCVTALVTMAITIIFKTSSTTNFAQGVISAFGAYVVAAALNKLDLSIWLALPIGVVVAVALMAALILGTVQYVRVCREYRAMMDYVVTVQNENVELRESYRSKVDLAAVEERALELGMIPVEMADKITIRVEQPVPEPEQTIWDEIERFCKGLFA